MSALISLNILLIHPLGRSKNLLSSHLVRFWASTLDLESLKLNSQSPSLFWGRESPSHQPQQGRPCNLNFLEFFLINKIILIHINAFYYFKISLDKDKEKF